MNPHERGFPAFLAEPGRGRMMRLLEMGEKRRRDVRSMLHHAVRLDPLYCTHLTGSDDSPESLERILRDRGAPDECHVIAVGDGLDGRSMPLREAIRAVDGENAIFISCLPGRLGFFNYSAMKSAWLLHRPGGT